MSYKQGKSYEFGIDDFFSFIPSYLKDVPSDEKQFKIQQLLYGADPTGIYRGYLEMRDSGNYWNDYFANTGLSWSDVKYPTRMYGYGSAGGVVRSSVNFIGHNLKRLYS